jgi:hypothetical protein
MPTLFLSGKFRSKTWFESIAWLISEISSRAFSAYDLLPIVALCAFLILEAETICIARVTFLVLLIDFMRLSISCNPGMVSFFVIPAKAGI